MSPTRPLEEQLLRPAERALADAAPTPAQRLEVLEAAASRLGGFSFGAFRKRFAPTAELSDREALEAGGRVLEGLRSTPIPPSLALCALARPQLTTAAQRSSGAYYTDFRLAQHVASAAGEHLVSGSKVIDPAAGTGILLVAAVLSACGPDRLRRARWLAEGVTAWDMSAEALRGARLALASLTDDLGAVSAMTSSWRCHDSLLAGDRAAGAYDVVLGNPPWEKIKLTRHEFLKANGEQRHYGAEYARETSDGIFDARRREVARYGAELAARYQLLGGGEPDLYKAFLELFFTLAREGGCVSVLVPAGLIRAQGTEDLRRFLFSNAGELSFTVMENRARFFAIDTRFKFLGVALTKASAPGRQNEMTLKAASGMDDGVRETGSARLSRKTLETLRPDLTVPEVRSEREWRLFRRMSEQGTLPTAPCSKWRTEIVREVDMTRDRPRFARSSGPKALPLIEGRMVHQHHFGAKAYHSGTGRSARWEVSAPGVTRLAPQFFYPRDALPAVVADRAARARAGFCDITGQTNERSMLAALVPAGVVCGNKVPTVTFPDDPSESRLFLWLGVVNSIPFDWALRRTVTTTVNYFVLNNLPLPRLEPDSLPGRRIIDAARELHAMASGGASADLRRRAELRASIDVAVLSAYGLEFADLELMFHDFPLLDRSQPALDGEERSTVTRDFVLAHAAERLKTRKDEHADRALRAAEVGAVPYVPSEHGSTETEADDGRALDV